MSTADDQLDTLLARLLFHQHATLDLLHEIGEHHYLTQYHPDLSPIGWHVGHCVYTETYWVQEAWLQYQDCDDSLKSLYIPELSNKAARGHRLPEFSRLKEWAEETQSNNRALIEQNRTSAHRLMDNNFLIAFLNQHYAQHYETMQMSLQLKAMRHQYDYVPRFKLESKPLNKALIEIEQNRYAIGSDPETVHRYDNELPRHQVQTESFQIAQFPVSNAEFLGFLDDDAYQRQVLWSKSGLQWIEKTNTQHPLHWSRTSAGDWFQITHNGPEELLPDDPVNGVNYYETNAFAKWAGARLPHEYEWEIAAKQHRLDQQGLVWEWCHNDFHPYPGFKPYPYHGYSAPYFDGEHFTLKGGSRLTRAEIKRPCFRNYYQPDKRHIFAGLRLVYDE